MNVVEYNPQTRSEVIVAHNALDDCPLVSDQQLSVKPYVGQMFTSVDVAKSFYTCYGGKAGFSVRSYFTKQRIYKNTKERKFLQQLFVCSREGFSKQKMAEKAHTVMIAFNNHSRGQAVQNAKRLKEILGEIGIGE